MFIWPMSHHGCAIKLNFGTDVANCAFAGMINHFNSGLVTNSVKTILISLKIFFLCKVLQYISGLTLLLRDYPVCIIGVVLYHGELW